MLSMKEERNLEITFLNDVNQFVKYEECILDLYTTGENIPHFKLVRQSIGDLEAVVEARKNRKGDESLSYVLYMDKEGIDSFSRHSEVEAIAEAIKTIHKKYAAMAEATKQIREAKAVLNEYLPENKA